MVMTPDCHPTPGRETLDTSNILAPNPRGTLIVTDQPLGDIGRWWTRILMTPAIWKSVH